MTKFKKLLTAKVLFILLAAGALGYVDSITDWKLGLDLKGGTQLDYTVDLSKVAEEDQAAIVEGVQEVIRKRVDGLGVSEPSIYTSKVGNEQHIIVELAGVSNIEDAKAIVGKTIQLEFREENTEVNTQKVDWANGAAQSFYQNLLQTGDFKTLAEASKKEHSLDVNWTEDQLQAVDSYPTAIQDAIAGKNKGDILAPFELDEGYILDESNQLAQSKGMAVIQIVDRSSTERSTEVEESVSARHILIAYEGAERSSATRTKEEAKTLADELLGRIKNGEKLSDLAMEYSDDNSGKEGGDLKTFQRGLMTQAFEEAAFNLEVGGISEVVETEFGFHIIEVYAKQEAGTETETIEQVAINKIVFSTLPNPWKEEAALTGEHFQHADVIFNNAYQPIVSITFTKEGGELFKELTEKNLGKQIAIFVGGELVSAPKVDTVIPDGNGTITGSFDLEKAQKLARDLNTGAIPAPIELTGQYTISATLGSEALDQSLFAGFIGFLVLSLFMIVYYRLPGVLAVLALTIYGILMAFLIKTSLPTWAALLIGLAVFVYTVYLILKNKDSSGEKFVSFLLACVVLFFLTFVLSSGITLTLAGIAGVVLSIGMAVDANVLIFERLREELAEGKSVHSAIEDGFKRAWDSIRDSNFSSLITCAILFYFGSSIIRGFALNLALGILVSMFSAIMLSRTFLHFVTETGLAKKRWLFGMAPITHHLPLMQKKGTWFALSGLMTLVAVVSIAVFGMKLGMDFTGGTLMELRFPEGTSSEQVHSSITKVEESLASEFGTPHIVETDQGTFLIRLQTLNESQHDAVMTEFKTSLGETEEIRFTTVGPVIGKSLKHRAFVALIVTMVMIVLYIAFAFRKLPKEVSPWKFGISAIVALVHDILIVVGIFSLLGHYAGVEVDALFITALLTIMGFSVHDTIVVFDRIRENLRFRASGETLEETANKALNQTMARSINTSLCALITILALLIFGADSTKMFVLALVLGITVGTYSSVFVASPLMVAWSEWSARKN